MRRHRSCSEHAQLRLGDPFPPGREGYVINRAPSRESAGAASAGHVVGSRAGRPVVSAGGVMAVNYSAKEEADGHPAGGGPGGGAAAGGGGAVKTRKPDNTAFKQQRLPAWQPILTAGTVLPAFFIIGLIFIPIGIGIFVTSNNIREYEVRGDRASPQLWAWGAGPGGGKERRKPR